MTGKPILLAAASLALLVPAPAFGASGVANGVHVRTAEGGVVVYFGKHASRAFRQVRGRQLLVTCTNLGDLRSLSRTDFSEGTSQPTSRRLRLIRVDMSAPESYDLCEVGRAGRPPAAIVPLSADGRTWVDERRAARKLLFAITAGADLSPDGVSFAPTAVVVAASHGALGAAYGTLVALSGPDASPPAGAVGYYSDGARHAVAATLSRTGKRLYVAFDDGAISSNVTEHMNAI